ncbi:MAG TPA: DUF3857 domain-containing protein [Candidatus Acidoferrum sp.]
MNRTLLCLPAFSLGVLGLCLPAAHAQKSTAPPSKLPAQIELLETHIKIDSNGDSRKELHMRVHINDELGARQFARLDFNYNREYEHLEIPLVRITHAAGGTADILPSATTDQPDPAIVNVPAFQSVRVKSVRILGLEPSDLLEYRVITTISHPPLAPNFYFSHDFVRDGIVAREIYEVDLPASVASKPATSQSSAKYETDKTGDGDTSRVLYRWTESNPSQPAPSAKLNSAAALAADASATSDASISASSDVIFSSFSTWTDTLPLLRKSFALDAAPSGEIKAKAQVLTRNLATPEEKLRALFKFVSQKIATLDLAIDATQFRLRPPLDVMTAAAGTPEEKCALLAALSTSLGIPATPALTTPKADLQHELPVPSLFTNVFVLADATGKSVWLDPASEVAPFGMIASNLRGKPALVISPLNAAGPFTNIVADLPFSSAQRVNVDATLAPDGKLNAKVHYLLRGDNELLLRVAFHKTPRDKWKEVAQLLSLSDGFRGQIGAVTASDPFATNEPFSVEYEITQPKFVDWSKKSIHIPVLLPLLGLPDAADPSAARTGDGKPATIDLGTPLEVTAQAILHLPANTSAQIPTGTSVEREYAVFSSQYSSQGSTVTATRHINFLQRQVPVTHATDYNAFLHVVQTDQSQVFTLQRSGASPPPSPATKTSAAVTAKP